MISFIFVGYQENKKFLKADFWLPPGFLKMYFCEIQSWDHNLYKILPISFLGSYSLLVLLKLNI